MKGSTVQHQNLLKRSKLLISKEMPEARIFDRIVGKFILIRFIQDVISCKMELKDWKKYMISINKKGMADAYCLINIKNLFQIHIEIEYKSGQATQSIEQKIWEHFIVKFGGKYIVCRNEFELLESLKTYKKMVETLLR